MSDSFKKIPYFLIKFLISGENVRDFFFRAVSLTFEAAVLREIDTTSPTQTQEIGNDFVSE